MTVRLHRIRQEGPYWSLEVPSGVRGYWSCIYAAMSRSRVERRRSELESAE